MSALLFPDTTVLVNFALLGRIDLFAALANGRGTWSAAVAEETHRSARMPGLGALRAVPAVLGPALVPTSERELVDVQALRTRLAVPGDHPRSHLGEAESLALIGARQLDAVFVTDDRGARRAARVLGVPTYSTCHLLKLAVRVDLLSAGQAWDAVTLLRRGHRHLLDSPRDQIAYRAWCAA